ncbi:Apolipoprotein A-I protein [Dioscorea alata]|uniref:Apolipoprotein A-I protein n=1 Tax=Dioscorea alata TaxID=55571 RepID=A0ACB7UP49_DIOAL|nr:Apolipoprotein A-I protein [Dioscorea alata]
MAGEVRGIKESLHPIMSQLSNAKRQTKASSDSEVKKLFDRIEQSLQRLVQVVDHPTKKLEEDLEKFLQNIAREIDTMLQNINITIETDLKEELQKIVNQADSNLENMKKKMEEAFETEQEPVKAKDNAPLTGSSINAEKPSSSNAKEEQRVESGKYYEKKEVLARLRLTIDELDLQIQNCFFCLGVFPENSVIKKRLLIYLWIGWGIVVPVKNITAEQVSERCFTELVIKDLVQPIYKKHRQIVDSCRINSNIRQVMISEGEKRRFFFSERVTDKILTDIISEPTLLKQGSLRVVRYSRKDSLALVNIDEQYLQFKSNVEDQTNSEDEATKIDNFAVLQLGRWESEGEKPPHTEMESIEFLKNLGDERKSGSLTSHFSKKEKTLGYLSLHGVSRITELPDTIGKLDSLIIMDLRACHNLERLPKDMASLKRLTHLDVSNCYLLDQLPKSIASLINLQVLKGFVMGSSRSKDPCKLSDLPAKLTKLRKLSFTVSAGQEHMQPEFDKLKEFTALQSLTITWAVEDDQSKDDGSDNQKEESNPAVATSTAQRENKEQVFADMTIPVQLEKLDIRAFPRKETPQWLLSPDLKKLERLYIRGGKLLSFGAEMSSGSVQVLRLRFLKDLSVEWKTLHEKFPSLKYLEVCECSKLEENFKEFLDVNGIWKKK